MAQSQPRLSSVKDPGAQLQGGIGDMGTLGSTAGVLSYHPDFMAG